MNPNFLLYIFIFLSGILFWGCSDHSEDKEDNDEHDNHQVSDVTFSHHMAEEFGIEYETVSSSSFNDVIKTSGTIESAGSDIFTASAKKSGIITLMNGIELGTEVSNGRILASISTNGIQGGDVNLAADANLKAAKTEYERLKPLYEDGLVTASVFREAERAYREAEALTVKNSGQGGSSAVVAPSQGSIISLFVKSGDFVEVGAPVAAISKNSTRILKADIPIREAGHIPEIETASFIPEGFEKAVRLEDVKGKKISGPNIGNAVNGYIPVYFSFVGNDISFSGGYAEIFLECGTRNGVISVPREAILEMQGNKFIYVATGEDTYEKRLVKPGASNGIRIEIKEGLAPGEKIVSKGASIIRMAELSSVAPPSHSHSH